jgi:hypothetical protein
MVRNHYEQLARPSVNDGTSAWQQFPFPARRVVGAFGCLRDLGLPRNEPSGFGGPESYRSH